MRELERTLRLHQTAKGPIVLSTRAEVLLQGLSPASQTEVARLLDSAHRRSTTPLRKAFLRAPAPDSPVPPLAQIVSTKGRGGGVPLKLYLGLIRRSSAAPYETNLSARRWASLLNLEEPNTLGARRIHAGLDRLQDLNLIEVTPSRGEASVVTLLREDASGEAYSPPSAPGQGERRYLQAPDSLWNGHIQQLSGPALAMLLILLAEPGSQGDGMWWSVENFPAWYRISESMRARGTRELIEFGLLRVTKRMLDTPRGGNSDQRDRVRNIYRLHGQALGKSKPATVTTTPSVISKSKKQQRRTQKRRAKE